MCCSQFLWRATHFSNIKVQIWYFFFRTGKIEMQQNFFGFVIYHIYMCWPLQFLWGSTHFSICTHASSALYSHKWNANICFTYLFNLSTICLIFHLGFAFFYRVVCSPQCSPFLFQIVFLSSATPIKYFAVLSYLLIILRRWQERGIWGLILRRWQDIGIWGLILRRWQERGIWG